ncbi:MAG: hypothetical protein K0U39_09135 [Alphaproteobacteria bacterium]|nr:hypothetical protein [Alphaproteobacteria bacterium]
MNKPLHTPKIFILFIFMTSFAFSAHHANAQEAGANQSRTSESKINQEAVGSGDEEETDIIKLHREVALSLGNMLYTQPETRNNDEYYSLLWRLFVQTNEGGRLFFFTDLEFASTPSDISDVDGLTREDQYLKLGGGYSFNKTSAPTTFFSSLGAGIITFEHHVKGVAAWYPASDTRSFQNIIYENYGIYLEAELGFKLQNRHKLSFYYIHSIPQQNLKARDNVHYSVAVPDEIINGIVGFRYSFLFWEETFDRKNYNKP